MEKAKILSTAKECYMNKVFHLVKTSLHITLKDNVYNILKIIEISKAMTTCS